MSDVLRFMTCGSVDDGKSTLIGRLLYDTRAVLVDTLEGVRHASERRGLSRIDLSLLTDGLIAEREQGITIDVAYRYFSTGRRNFIIADAPGHEQYTRNMVTAASTAELAVLMVDVRQGLTTQTRRHALLCELMGIPHLVIAVNKMDLVGYDPEPFAAVQAAFETFAAQAQLRADRRYLPISALEGEMVVERGERMPWYQGPTLLEVLESVPSAHTGKAESFRFPVQWVCRPQAADDPTLHDYRGYAGMVTSGSVAVGDAVTVLPAGLTTTVQAIELGGQPLTAARAGQSVMLRLQDDLDVSRGDMIVRSDEPMPAVTRALVADLAWLANGPLDPRRVYGLRQTTREVKAKIEAIAYRWDVATMRRADVDTLTANDIGRVRVKLSAPIVAERYEEDRALGAFILFDPATGDTVAGGVIREWA
ncbi:sulfate adenylyltransferase subunit 1 [Hydrogenophilus thiooxidans]|uniref:sulfate adenylyltransferase subunit 1 n=1 Tax=Hydrogenophilus thiooxidans TaxID=2820326 RepID=UPI001C24E341|nr:GTP-binding protein [Hydrogenophilus thiooxidans]